jgi:biopolymer transport protein ExbD
MKRRNKVSAEFSMSSLTDIIFLLLIFFMLTSSMVQINVELPESDSKTVAPTDITVMMTKDGKLTFNGKKTTVKALKSQIQSKVGQQKNQENATVAIVAEKGVQWNKVNEIMTIAASLRMKAIIATQPRG